MTTTTTTARQNTGSDPVPASPAAQARRPIDWRTVATVTALIYAAAIPAAIALHHTTADPAVTTVCIHGITTDARTEPGGQISLTVPFDAPACTTTDREGK